MDVEHCERGDPDEKLERVLKKEKTMDVEHCERGDPDEKLERVLKECGWTWVKTVHSLWRHGRIRFFTDDLLQKGKNRLLVDEIGVFLYRKIDDRWERTAGRSHDLIAKHLPRKRIKFDGITLDLLTGACNASR